MEVIAECPKCKQAIRLEGGALDRRIRCLKCGRLFKVPDPAELNKAIKTINGAKSTIYVDEEGKIYG